MQAALRCAVTLLMAAASCVAQLRQPERLAPYVPSPQPVVERMLEAANLKPGETVYDLGCGDGRILITAAEKFRARGVGVELSAKLVAEAEEQVRQRGLQNWIRIQQGDLLEADLSGADVVTVYLLTSSNARLQPKFEQSLKAGSRVVSHDFAFRGWKPARVEKVAVAGRTHTIYVYEMGRPPLTR